MSRDDFGRAQNARAGGRGGEVARLIPSRSNGRSEPLSFLGRRVPSAFEKHTVTIEPRHTLKYDETRWRDSLVIVERGLIELECRSGSPTRFASGAVLCLEGLPVLAIHNRGSEPAVLVAVSRRND
jgi:hypothetical protein